MLQTLTCPKCSNPVRVPPSMLGQEVQCPTCMQLFASKLASASLLQSGTAPAAPPNRTVLAEPEAMIYYTCPRCKRALESPASFGGQKLNCPGCNQRLQIPQPSTPPAPALNKTILATEEKPTAGGSASPGLRPPPIPGPSPAVLGPVMEVELVEVAPATSAAPAAVRRECCLECGVDVTQRPRVQTCPDCGSLLCSSMCYRAHRYYAHASKSRPRARIVECDRCGSTARPYYDTKISEGGWITFVILLIVFFPLCWIGLLITETQVRCSDCGARLA
jgi:DNA-directed RNA polymerase subunit RPC12/RpoP